MQEFAAIFLGIGANLAPDGFAGPRQGCEAAIATLDELGIEVLETSPWYESAPVPVSDQPWYLNAVIAARTRLSAPDTLSAIHGVEARFGRTRSVRNAARVLDIDLLDHGGTRHADDGIEVPHPRLWQRAFVLLPLRDVAPHWRHPTSGRTVDELIDALPPGQDIRRAG